ncbi:hypothetical protein CsSME_00002813 [Camellia sinensis var. sinensis]
MNEPIVTGINDLWALCTRCFQALLPLKMLKKLEISLTNY